MGNNIIKTIAAGALAACLAQPAIAQAPAAAGQGGPTPVEVVTNPTYTSIIMELNVNKPAADVWKRVIASEPDVAGNHQELAEALLKAGDLAQSLTAFATAAELDGVAAVHLRIAAVLDRLGRTRESALARQTYVRLRLEDYRRQAGR